MKPPILILHATGTNRDRDAAYACTLAGGAPQIVHLNALVRGERRLGDFRMLVLPGGFSHGDHLGAGRLWATALRYRLADDLLAFVAAGRPVLGICNGFQALVKAGLLPGTFSETASDPLAERPPVTLTRNDSGRFECRWVYLRPEPGGRSVFTRDLDELVYCPVAHGEGKLVARDEETFAALEAQGLVALRYVGAGGERAGYPWNPNGSWGDVAGICNRAGNVLGLMPHPENAIVPHQHPRFHRGERGMLGLPLIRRGVAHAAQS